VQAPSHSSAEGAATITVSCVDRTARDPEAQTRGFSIDKV